MKRKIIEIKAGRGINLVYYGICMPNIDKVWTIYDEEEMWNYCKFSPLTGKPAVNGNLDDLFPVHRHGVFLEDRLHDWNLHDNIFDYYSRTVSPGNTIKLLIEYENKCCGDCHYWKPDGGFDIPFCEFSGLSIGHGKNGHCGPTELEFFQKHQN